MVCSNKSIIEYGLLIKVRMDLLYNEYYNVLNNLVILFLKYYGDLKINF